MSIYQFCNIYVRYVNLLIYNNNIIYKMYIILHILHIICNMYIIYK